MKKYLLNLTVIGGLSLIIINAETNSTKENNLTQESNQTKNLKKILIIDLDKELEEQGSRGKEESIVYGMLSFGDNNDEVAFVGQMLSDASNTIIVIEDDNGNVKRTITNSLTIQTAWLTTGDKILIKQEDKVLMEKEVEKY